MRRRRCRPRLRESPDQRSPRRVVAAVVLVNHPRPAGACSRMPDSMSTRSRFDAHPAVAAIGLAGSSVSRHSMPAIMSKQRPRRLIAGQRKKKPKSRWWPTSALRPAATNKLARPAGKCPARMRLGPWRRDAGCWHPA
jgi:hypothetical protein